MGLFGSSAGLEMPLEGLDRLEEAPGRNTVVRGLLFVRRRGPKFDAEVRFG